MQELDKCLEATALLAERIRKGDLATLPEGGIVDLGAALVHLTANITKALEPIKAYLRAGAVHARKGGPGATTFTGDGGQQCVVVIPTSKVRVKATVDIAQLQQALGADFDRYFEATTKYTPSKDFFEVAGKADPEVAQVLFEVVEVYSDTPRVSFAHNPR